MNDFISLLANPAFWAGSGVCGLCLYVGFRTGLLALKGAGLRNLIIVGVAGISIFASLKLEPLNKAKAQAASTRGEAPKPSQEDPKSDPDDGTYAKQFPQVSLSNQACLDDSDCAITPYYDGSCCPEPCNKEPHVFNKDTLERMRAHQRDVCKDRTLRCAKPKCSRPLFDRVATCTEGQCTIQKVWPERKRQKATAPTRSKAPIGTSSPPLR